MYTYLLKMGVRLRLFLVLLVISLVILPFGQMFGQMEDPKQVDIEHKQEGGPNTRFVDGFEDWLNTTPMHTPKPGEFSWNISDEGRFSDGFFINSHVENAEGGEIKVSAPKDPFIVDASQPKILSMTGDEDGNVYLGMSSGLIYVHNVYNGTTYALFDGDPVFSGMNYITALTTDHWNRVWGACAGNGHVFYIENMKDRYDLGQVTTDPYIRTMTYSKNGRIWGGTASTGEMFYIDTTDVLNQYVFKPFGDHYYGTYSMIYDERQDRVWASTGDPFNMLLPNHLPDPEVLKIDPNPAPANGSFESKTEAFGENAITCLAIDENGNLYMGSKGEGRIYIRSPDDSTGSWACPEPEVKTIFVGEVSNAVYVGTGGGYGLYKFRSHSGEFFQVNHPGGFDPKNVNNLIGNEFIGIWGTTNESGHLFNMNPLGIWFSPIFNATGPAIWARAEMDAEIQPDCAVLALVRYSNDLDELKQMDFEDNFISRSMDLDYNDSQYIQYVVLLVSDFPFGEKPGPWLRSMEFKFDFEPKCTIDQICDTELSVVNGIVEYELMINNTGQGNAYDPEVSFYLPDQMDIHSCSEELEEREIENSEDSLLIFELGHIPPGDERSIDLSLVIDPDVEPETVLKTNFQLNYTDVRSRWQEELKTNDWNVTVVSPNVFLSFDVSKKLLNPGESFISDLIISVDDVIDVRSLNISTFLPDFVKITNSTHNFTSHHGHPDDDSDIDSKDEFYFFEIAHLPKDEKEHIRLEMEIEEDVGDQTKFIMNYGLRYYDDLMVNEHKINTEDIDIEVIKPIMEIELVQDPASQTEANIGEKLSFFMRYSNKGHDNAVNVTISVWFSDSLYYSSGSGDQMIEWTYDKVPSETMDVEIPFNLKVLHSAANDSEVDVWAQMKYQYPVSQRTYTIDMGHIKMPILRPDVQVYLEKMDGGSIEPEGEAHYKLTWENNGDGYSQGLKITTTLGDSSLTFKSGGSSENVIDTGKLDPNEDHSQDLFITASEDIETDRDVEINIDVEYTDAFNSPYRSYSFKDSIHIDPKPLPSEPFTIQNFDPPTGKEGIIETMVFKCFFSHIVDESTVDGAVSIEPAAGINYYIINKTELRIEFTEPLEPGKTYKITIANSILDEDGRTLDRSYEWNIRTNKEEVKEEGDLTVPCLIVAVLAIIALIVLMLLVYRQKKIKDRIAEVEAEKARQEELEEADIVYTPDHSPEPVKKSVAKAKPISQKKKVEKAVQAKVLADDVITSSSEPPKSEPRVEETPSEVEPKVDDEPGGLEDPYSIKLDVLGAQGSPKKPVLALPPAVFLDNEAPAEETPYNIDEILVMTAEGILVQHFTAKGASEIDEDILAGMLTAVQMFVKDTFGGGGKDSVLDELSLGDFKIMIGRGKYLTMSVILSGEETNTVRPQLDALIEEVESKYSDILAEWDGDMASMGGMKDDIKDFVEGKYRVE